MLDLFFKMNHSLGSIFVFFAFFFSINTLFFLLIHAPLLILKAAEVYETELYASVISSIKKHIFEDIDECSF